MPNRSQTGRCEQRSCQNCTVHLTAQHRPAVPAEESVAWSGSGGLLLDASRTGGRISLNEEVNALV